MGPLYLPVTVTLLLQRRTIYTSSEGTSTHCSVHLNDKRFHSDKAPHYRKRRSQSLIVSNCGIIICLCMICESLSFIKPAATVHSCVHSGGVGRLRGLRLAGTPKCGLRQQRWCHFWRAAPFPRVRTAGTTGPNTQWKSLERGYVTLKFEAIPVPISAFPC